MGLRPPPGFRLYALSLSRSGFGTSGSAASQNPSVISHAFFCFSGLPPCAYYTDYFCFI